MIKQVLLIFNKTIFYYIKKTEKEIKMIDKTFEGKLFDKNNVDFRKSDDPDRFWNSKKEVTDEINLLLMRLNTICEDNGISYSCLVQYEYSEEGSHLIKQSHIDRRIVDIFLARLHDSLSKMNLKSE